MPTRDRDRWVARAAALLLLAGWAALIKGLFYGVVQGPVASELEAGGRFALNVTVFFPAVLLAGAALVFGLIALVRGRHTGGVLAGAVAGVVFAC